MQLEGEMGWRMVAEKELPAEYECSVKKKMDLIYLDEEHSEFGAAAKEGGPANWHPVSHGGAYDWDGRDIGLVMNWHEILGPETITARKEFLQESLLPLQREGRVEPPCLSTPQARAWRRAATPLTLNGGAATRGPWRRLASSTSCSDRRNWRAANQISMPNKKLKHVAGMTHSSRRQELFLVGPGGHDVIIREWGEVALTAEGWVSIAYPKELVSRLFKEAAWGDPAPCEE